MSVPAYVGCKVDSKTGTSTDYDRRYISLGAGVQSSTLYLLSVEGVTKMGRGLADEEYIENGCLPPVDFACFADTQSEPKGVYVHLEYLVSSFSHIIPIRTPTGGSLRDDIVRSTEPDGPRFASVPFWVTGDDGRPSPGRRQCTRQAKIDVVKKEVRTDLGLRPKQRAVGKFRVEEWIGISLDEATRAKPSRYEWVTSRWPLLYDLPMRRSQCIEWIDSHGYHMPVKSACTFCPYRDHNNWIELRENDPEAFEDACQVDDLIRVNGPLWGTRREQYVHNSMRPLREVIDDPDYEDRNLNLFENECEGMCGV